MLKHWLCHVNAKLTIRPNGPFLVKSGRATVHGPDAAPVTTYRSGEEVLFIPGSSLKGVIRSHVERIARSIHLDSVCEPYLERAEAAADGNDRRIGCSHRLEAARRGGAAIDSVTAYRTACAACRLFGSLRFIGRIRISDAYPKAGEAKPVAELRDNVAIDRFTGGAASGKKFDQVVVQGGAFETEISIDNFELWQLAALDLVLADFADGILAIGSGTSRGLGAVKAEVDSLKLSYLRPQERIAGIGQLCEPATRNAYALSEWRPGSQPDLPAGERRGIRYVVDVTGQWRAQLDPLVPGLEAFLQERGTVEGQRAHARAGA
ncbi:MAG: CRISPR-associated RAMP protein [Candidatus Schekmanbacteria bacterium]|nr:CRISPR-associated RAMP protein [Candidatus Schekmanbacteria bacterium]